jgi:hypothetical protein
MSGWARSIPDRSITCHDSVADYLAAVRGLVRNRDAFVDASLSIPVLSQAGWSTRREAGSGAVSFDKACAIYVVTGSEFESCGRLLAACTQREVRAFPTVESAIQEISDNSVSLVADPDHVTPARLAALPTRARVGILTARDLPAMSELVARIITLRGRKAPLRNLTVFWGDPNDPGGQTEDRMWGMGATRSALRERLEQRLDLLSFVTAGRGCSAIVSDGLICGQRADGRGWMAGHSERRPTSCQRGRGCYRFGWGKERMLYGHELNADIVLVNACRALHVSDGQFSPDVSLALSVLEGSAIAFISSIYKGSRAPQLPFVLRDLLSGGVSLGVAAARLNEEIAADSSRYGRLCLVGDAGLALMEPAGPAQSNESQAETWPVRAQSSSAERMIGKLALLDAVRPVTLNSEYPKDESYSATMSRALIRYVNTTVLVDYDVNDVEISSIREVVRLVNRTDFGEPGSESRRRAAELLNCVQRRLVQSQVEKARSTYFHFEEQLPGDFQISAGPDVSCHNCGRPGITNRITYPRTRLAELIVHLCSLCSEVFEGSPMADCGFSLVGPESVRVDEQFAIEFELTNQGACDMHVVVGGVLRRETFFQATLCRTDEAVIGPGARFSMRIHGTVPSGGPAGDLHTVKVFCMIDGQLSLLSKPVWIYD